MNWICPYCGGQNYGDRKKCVTCKCSPSDWDLDKANQRIGSVVAAGVMVLLFNSVVLLLGDRFLDSYQKDLRLGSIILTVALTIGVLRKSRVCAVLLPMLRAFGVIVEWQVTGKIFNAVFFFVIDGYFLFKAIRGTFAYHRIVSTNCSAAIFQNTIHSNPQLQQLYGADWHQRDNESELSDDLQAGHIFEEVRYHEV